MAAKGSFLKEDIIKAILETFPGAFRYDKEIRIPGVENGENLQIKVSLTCAKTNVEPDGDAAIPGAKITVTKSTDVDLPWDDAESTTTSNIGLEPTAEEKANVAALIKKLNL
jgi:hypothetical protein